MKTLTISPILAAATAALFAGAALLALSDQANAGKAGSPKAMTGRPKFDAGPRSAAVRGEFKATTTGTNKAKPPREVRDHRAGSQGGGVKVIQGRERKSHICAGWGCPKPPPRGVRDHRKNPVSPPGPPSPGKNQRK